MSVDYAALREENRLEYGRAIGRIGKMLLEDRYDKRTHFIYEVLQNTEDALRRRAGWNGSRAVTFALTHEALRISHFGAPFSEPDVRGVCGINASTKDVTSIGRFGIGFKSVYAFTERPEIHSGDESFSVSEYVFPRAVASVTRHPDETLILLPLRAEDTDAFKEIAEGLRALGAEALLFLKHVEEIVWSVEGEDAGNYRRSSTGDGFACEVELTTCRGSKSSSQSYLRYSRDVESKGKRVGQAELAFRLETLEDGSRAVQPISDARLVVFFPTVLPTHTGFLVQGPYQTTPSRDNIPADKPWNIELAQRTGELLVEVLEHLRESGMLSVATLRTLPLDRSKMAGGLFQPLYDSVVAAMRSRRLLPTSTGSFATAAELRLARAQDVRELFGAKQLSALIGEPGMVVWASADITADRAPQLRSFLMQELKIPELTLDQMLARTADAFLKEQPDAWMIRFYRLLASQPALMRSRTKDMALYRLEDGTHVPLTKNGIRQVFLPTGEKTGFPTLRAELVAPQTQDFLESAGLTKPDPVDDVIHHLLPAYREKSVKISSYAEDVARILRAFETDSHAQREKLVGALRTATIVIVRDAKTQKKYISRPGEVYLATARLTKVFEGVERVLFVDAEYECLRGEKIREMLEACGATRILRPQTSVCDLSQDERQAARRAAGWEGYSSENAINDVDIAGLKELLELLPGLPEEEQRERALLLWEAMAELVDRRGVSILSIPYTWIYHQTRSTMVDAGFLRRLNQTAWIPDASGVLRLPSEVVFEELGWPRHAVLEARIEFRPPAISALAREVGIDPDVLDELKRLGVTDLEQLRSRLREEARDDEGEATNDDERDGGGDVATGHRQGDGSGTGDAGGCGSSSGSGGRPGGGHSGGSGGRKHSSGGGGTREFISYVGVRPDGEQGDPDGLTQRQRLDLEEAAIALILRLEPVLERTPAGNTGFDLVEKDVAGEPERWVEVKAMKGSLADRPVGLSGPQMEQARRCGDQFWLYVVERAGSDQARVLRIRNPHGRAGTFTFDRGWEGVAAVIEARFNHAAE
ncbi:sacsin N-terminal ATP-binding-like domain-containing protein [Sabulicella glaciei]|uniref:DUF3883 domain-containing protein n=1 Tax=Sabulicella glaciei TaxID=2984948 RepID=A0ABT3NZR1_9PROT|nr:DUF3883 domain-containing protein [Roseococcus sp. MDT2-1-1]MCW8087651.1 DUF3883 domain-containing protein [Roseococcus sp. MDT2-1-1]